MVFGFGARKQTPASARTPSTSALPTVDAPDRSDASADASNEDAVNPLRFLSPECICLSCRTQPTPAAPDETEAQQYKRRLADKEAMLQELTDLLDRSGNIVNPTKFFKDMVNRERRATTAIAPAIAIPHVRSSQVRRFTIAFARADAPGIDFDSLDGKPTRFFFCLAGSNDRDKPEQDRLFLKIYRQFAQMLQHDWMMDALADVQDEQELLNLFRGYING